MSPRVITNLLVLHAGGFVVVSSQSFGANTTGWIGFGIAVGILGVTAVAQRERTRGVVQSALDAIVGSLAVWSVVASVVFEGSALTWLSPVDALGFAGFAVVGLVAHEFSTERGVRSLAAAGRSDAAVKAADSYAPAA